MVTVVDAEVDYSQYTDISQVPFASWRGSESAFARLSILDGCLHFHSTEATNPSWDCQFFPIGMSNAEPGVTYTLHYKVKGTVEKNVSMLGFGTTPYGQFPITTEWVEGTFDYVAASSDGNLLMQCGDYVGDWDIAYLKITHEEREQAPVQWDDMIVNGDAEGEYGDVACAYSKEFGENLNADGQPQPHPAPIVTDVDGNKMFLSHHIPVNPMIAFEEDTNLWGTDYKAGEPMPDNAWQNQFWINLPEPIKEGTQLKVTFKYKASIDGVKADIQTHMAPGDYLGGFTPADITFSTDWQEFSQEFAAPAAGAAPFQSIAFNLGKFAISEYRNGVEPQFAKDIDFYFDDITVSTMVLEEGFFAAGANAETGIEYDYENAVKFDDNGGEFVGIVGTRGNQDSWVNEVMISTVRGNDKAFKSAALKVSGQVVNDPDVWLNYTIGSNAKIKLPVAGVWQIKIDPEWAQMSFEKLEGEQDLDPIDVIPNPTEIVVHGLERDYIKDDDHPDATGQPWDNQFFIVANRTLSKGEVTVVQFKYKASSDAMVSTQDHADPGAYLHYDALGNVNFTTDWQDFEKEFTVPAEADGMKSFAFNMAEIKEACDYYIKDVVWRIQGNPCYETLIDMEGTKNFFVKEGAGSAPYEFGTNVGPNVATGISNVVVNNAPAATYNLAGQRVSKEYKGIVVKNGSKYIVK